MDDCKDITSDNVIEVLFTDGVRYFITAT
ncbi:hypothetical protein ALC56_01203 [Trachymyrmex septentrionalis]|uniref:Uncharacterized protein n=1 Tax=Trachymyrmex septentrionalis TaxID=34720 RepID=A0A151K0R6_9HYME|nr:hypothetical protein ALC56_01203 [Trachymyrmex septentrionalis]